MNEKQPNPKRLFRRLQLDEADEYREIYCPFEWDCLSYAAERRWLSYSCKECKLREIGRKRKKEIYGITG